MASYIIITVLLTIFTMLNFASPCLFCKCHFVLNPFTFFTQPPIHLPSGNTKFVFCIYEAAFLLFVHLFYSFKKLFTDFGERNRERDQPVASPTPAPMGWFPCVLWAAVPRLTPWSRIWPSGHWCLLDYLLGVPLCGANQVVFCCVLK